jgi:hypothetical protein
LLMSVIVHKKKVKKHELECDKQKLRFGSAIFMHLVHAKHSIFNQNVNTKATLDLTPRDALNVDQKDPEAMQICLWRSN